MCVVKPRGESASQDWNYISLLPQKCLWNAVDWPQSTSNEGLVPLSSSMVMKPYTPRRYLYVTHVLVGYEYGMCIIEIESCLFVRDIRILDLDHLNTYELARTTLRCAKKSCACTYRSDWLR